MDEGKDRTGRVLGSISGKSQAANRLEKWLGTVTLGDSREALRELPDGAIHCVVTDPPFGISLDRWDILHDNRNSALLGQSPAQVGRKAFARRGKPINGWSRADREIGAEYEAWCRGWASPMFPKLVEGASLLVFGARRTIHRMIVAFEESGFVLRDVLSWEKPSAHHRAQRLSPLLEKRGLSTEAEEWEGWRLGNLAPMWEPIAWFFKPYRKTILDNVLEHRVGAMNTAICRERGVDASNVLKFGFAPGEAGFHPCQKPVSLLRFLIELSTRQGQVVLDPFSGSGSTAVACAMAGRHFVGFEKDPAFKEIAIQRLAALGILEASEASTRKGHGKEYWSEESSQ